MELSSLLEYIIKEWGLWAGVSMFLIWTTNKRNEERESRYEQTIDEYRLMLAENQEIIHKLATSFEEMRALREDIKDIKETIIDFRRDKE